MSIYEASPEAPVGAPAPVTSMGGGGSELSDPKLGQPASLCDPVVNFFSSICKAISTFVEDAAPGFQSVDAFKTNKKSWALTTIVAIFLAVVFFWGSISDEATKFENWVETTAGWGPPDPRKDRFVLVDKPMTWNKARQYCRTHYRDLASIHSKDENLQLHEHCKKTSSIGNCWIGLHQPAGASLTVAGGAMKPITAFNNIGKCNVDHRISQDVYDIPINSIQVSRVDGTKATFFASRMPDRTAPTLRKILMLPWNTVVGGNDQYKLIAYDPKAPTDKTKSLYLFSDGDIITDGLFDDVPVCPEAVLAHNEQGDYTQDTCTGTPNGLFSMAPPNAVNMFDKLLADSGECAYNPYWGWVVNAMWIIPDRNAVIAGTAAWKAMYKWSDGSAIDYNNWGDKEPSQGSEVQFSYEGVWQSADGAKAKRLRHPEKQGPARFSKSDKPGQSFICEVKPPRYSLIDIPMTWTAAKAYCREYYTDLASIHTEQDQQDAHNACKVRSGASPCYDEYTTKQQCAGNEGCWIGLTSGSETRTLEWSDGTPLDYYSWYPGQPATNDNDNEALLRMACDPQICPKGKWKMHNGRKRQQGPFTNSDPIIANESPFLCEGPARGSGGPEHSIESACSTPSKPGGNSGPNGR